MPQETDLATSLLDVEPLPGYEPTIGRLLWQLEDTRHETKEAVTDLMPATLDWTPHVDENSIGALLYHIALIELDWLYTEVLENQPWPEELRLLFAVADRDDQKHLSVVQGAPLDGYLHRLDLTRQRLLDSFLGMTVEEFRRPRSLPSYQVTPEWVLHHLIQHEAEHRGHIQLLRTFAEHAIERP